MLSIVEHPAFQLFYDELIQEGLACTTSDGMDDTNAIGDVIAAELREGFEAFDFCIPFILQDATRFVTTMRWTCPRCPRSPPGAERTCPEGQQGGDASGQALFAGEYGGVDRLAGRLDLDPFV